MTIVRSKISTEELKQLVDILERYYTKEVYIELKSDSTITVTGVNSTNRFTIGESEVVTKKKKRVSREKTKNLNIDRNIAPT